MTLTVHLGHNHQGTLKRQGLLFTVLEGAMALQWPHTKAPRGAAAQTGGSAYPGEGEVPGIPWVHWGET